MWQMLLPPSRLPQRSKRDHSAELPARAITETMTLVLFEGLKSAELVSFVVGSAPFWDRKPSVKTEPGVFDGARPTSKRANLSRGGLRSQAPFSIG